MKAVTTEYGIEHRPPDAESGAPLNDVTGGGRIYPDDFYEHPDWYDTGGGKPYWDAVDIVRRYRGRPNHTVLIYRALPRGILVVYPGDWVALTKGYARQHSKHATDPSRDLSIIAARVFAHDIHTSGDSLEEWGFNGPAPVKGTVVFRARPKPREKTYEELVLAAAQKRFANAIRFGAGTAESFVGMLKPSELERIRIKVKAK
jgi:hypothetical protein